MKSKKRTRKPIVIPEVPHKFHLGDAVIISQVKHKLYHHKRFTLPLVSVLSFAVIGGLVLIFRSHADPIYSTDPNDVVLEYQLPHLDIKPSENLLHTMYQPLRLYGDGSLFCGQQGHDQFKAPREHSVETLHHSNQTSTYKKLSKAQVTEFIQKVRDTGFENLNPEYYADPIAQQKHTIRLVANGKDKFVFYYNDTAAPEAYTKTLQVLQDACDSVTQTYVSNTVLLTARADADTHSTQPKGVDTVTNGKESVSKVLRESKSRKQQNDAKRASHAELEEGDNYGELITGSAAKELQKFSKGQNRLFLTENGTTYELGIDPQLPEVSNLLSVDIKQVRKEFEQKQATASKKVSLLERIGFTKRAEAFAVPEPEAFRLVYFYPSDGNNDAKLDFAKNEGTRVKNWYCNKVGRCPDYNGVVPVKGSHSKDWYEACHDASGCSSDRLSRVKANAFTADKADLSKNGVITVLIPAWAISTPYCGWGAQGGDSSIIDAFDTSCTNVAAAGHELGHNLDLVHVCSSYNLMVSQCASSINFCDMGGTRPACTLNSTQVTKLKKDYEHFLVPSTVVSGRVYDTVTGTGIKSVKIMNCVNNPDNYDNAQTTTTDENGRWSMRYTNGTPFCARVASTMTEFEGPVLTNNLEHAAATTYESQVSGKNCYKNAACTAAQQTWDRSTDTGYDFAYKRTNGSLYYIQKASTASGKVELQRAPAVSAFTVLEPKVVTPIPVAEAADGYFQVANDDLYFVKWRNTASGNVEINTLTRASNYGTVTKKVIGVPVAGLDTVRPVFYIDGDNLHIVKTLNAGQGGKIAIKRYDMKTGYNYVEVAGPTSEAEAGNGIFQFNKSRNLIFFKNKNTTLGNLAYVQYQKLSDWNEQIRESTYFSNTYAADVWPSIDRINGVDSDDVVVIRFKNTASGKVEIMLDRGPTYGNLDKSIVTVFPVNSTTNGVWVLSR